MRRAWRDGSGGLLEPVVMPAEGGIVTTTAPITWPLAPNTGAPMPVAAPATRSLREVA